MGAVLRLFGTIPIARWGVRVRLLIVISTVLMPLAAFVVWSVWSQQRAWEEHLLQEAGASADQIGAVVDSHLHFVEGVLASMAPLAAREKGKLRASDLAAIMQWLPGYATNVMVYDTHGRLLASHLPATRLLLERGIGDRAYFQQALQGGDVVISEPIVGLISGTRIVNSALAYRDPGNGSVKGVVVLTTNLARFAALALDPLVDGATTMGIFTTAGVPVAHSKHAAPQLEELRRVISHPAAAVIDTSRSMAAAPVKRAPWSVAVIVQSQHPSHKIPLQMLAVGLVAILFAALAAHLLARRVTALLTVMRNAATAIASGDLAHRMPRLRGVPDEVATFVNAFNYMAEQIESQRAMLLADEERFRAAFHGSPLAMVVWSYDDGVALEVNAAFCRTRGCTPQEAIGRTAVELGLWQSCEDRARVLDALQRNGRIQGLECRLATVSGDLLDILLFAETLQVDGRRVVMTQAVDVTDSRRIEGLRAESERKLQDVSSRLALATRTARIGIWELDLRSQRLAWDPTSFDLFGVAPADFTGTPEDWQRRLHHEDRAATVARKQAAIAGDGHADLDFRVIRGDGEVRHFRATMHVERDAAGQAVRLIGTNRDVTAEAQARAELARMNAELEGRVASRTAQLQETVRELEAFSYTVAHDLRAPLRAIDGFSSYLAKANPRDEGGLVARIRRNVSAMEGLIDGLLNYARLGRVDMKHSKIDMNALVAHVRSQMAESYPGVVIEATALPGARGDAVMLAQVWSNLLTNACKFSAGTLDPRVEVGIAGSPDEPVYFVRDNGVGFDMQYADRLFRVFERLHTDYAGSGVGLAMVQRVVQRHGGHVWAESAPGKGAAFFFRLSGNAASDSGVRRAQSATSE